MRSELYPVIRYAKRPTRRDATLQYGVGSGGRVAGCDMKIGLRGRGRTEPDRV